MKKYYFTILISIFTLNILSQNISNIRNIHNFSIDNDTIIIDTLSIIPNTFVIRDSLGFKIDTSFYSIDYFKSKFICKNPILKQNKNYIVAYRIFPYNFNSIIAHKKLKTFSFDQAGLLNPFISISKENQTKLFEGLNKSGSISRGVTFGNSQDVIVNSNFNLQLSGKITEDVEIVAAITDKNIPIQPEGNTQQIQDFDKVFIQLTKKNTKLIAGDFEIENSKDNFLKFYKKVQGASFSTWFNTKKVSNKDTINPLFISANAAISKGKYGRNIIQGTEGNQGPYKLKGNDNEIYIIVIAGSERIFIDGHLMVRGMENDYVIDYNTAEITFTSKRPITKDSRIVIEFQYSDKNYARSLFYFSNEYQTKDIKIKFNFYSEQDIKTQPLQQELSDTEKTILRNVGDSIQYAIASSVKEVPYSNDQVLYHQIDSLGYSPVYIHSNDTSKKFYRLNFSIVGKNKGNYVQVSSSANGKVYKWVVPINGIPQGDHEPIIQLISPKQKQMYSFNIDYNISKNTNINIESALSNNNLNMFSNINKSDDQGYGIKVNLTNFKTLNKPFEDDNKINLKTTFSHELVDKLFTPIERFRSVEMEREWNITKTNIPANENLTSLNVLFSNVKYGSLGYQIKSFSKGSQYNANQNILNLNLSKSRFNYKFNGSLLNTKGIQNKTQYIKYNTAVSRKFGWFTLAITDEMEKNSYFEAITDTLQTNSFWFNQWGANITNNDSVNKYNIFYNQRNDKLPFRNKFNDVSVAENMGFSVNLLKNVNNMLNLNTTYRTLRINDTNLIKQKPEKSLLGRIEYFLKLYKGTISSATFYEIGSGMEAKRDFQFVEVTAGQGIYTWKDYNNNGIKELNEFEVAAFRDQANFIKVYIVSNKLIKVYTNQFNQVLNINPSNIWNNKKGILKFMSRFSNQTTYHIERKTQGSDWLKSYNPFVYNKDSTLANINSTIRNIFSFNRYGEGFGFDINIQDNMLKTLLSNGFEMRSLTSQGIVFRTPITTKITLNMTANNGFKINSSDFFSTRDFKIYYYEYLPELYYQPSNKLRIAFNFKYTEKLNKLGLNSEKLISKNLGSEIKFNIVKKGSLLFKINYIEIKYNNTENTSIAFEMLEGLRNGSNTTWSLSYQANLLNYLQLNLQYDGRKTGSDKPTHVGSVMLRAYF